MGSWTSIDSLRKRNSCTGCSVSHAQKQKQKGIESESVREGSKKRGRVEALVVKDYPLQGKRNSCTRYCVSRGQKEKDKQSEIEQKQKEKDKQKE